MVIQNYDDYHQESRNILSDKDFYEKISDDPLPMLNKSLDRLLSDAKDELILTKEEIPFIKIEGASKPHFYHIPKIHKCLKSPPGRPIISGVNSFMCNLSHYLDLHLQEYVRKFPKRLLQGVKP